VFKLVGHRTSPVSRLRAGGESGTLTRTGNLPRFAQLRS
jgi:hypothetical protein